MTNGILDSGQKIITDGLVLNLDAAQLRSYPTTGTTWTDLSGNNNNGTLVNGPTFNSQNGGSIVFDGVNDFVQTVGGGNNLSDYTFSAWFLNNDFSEIKYILNRGRDNLPGWSLQLQIAPSGKPGVGVVTTLPSILGYGVEGTTVINLNTWYYITGVWTSNTSLQLYVNGILEGTISATGRTSLRATSTSWFMGSITTSNFTSGRIGMTQIYNRALTAQEILQNYNATKSRYGL